jgi:hypothetical protein
MINFIKAEGVEYTKYLTSISSGTTPKRHDYYKETKEAAQTMGVHVEGKTPKKLLEQKRPNEPEEVRKYRLETWKPVTKSLSDKVINTLNRVFNERYFKLKFPEKPGLIPTGEDLPEFLLEDYGIYQSVWKFIKETLLKITLSDPNALCFIRPVNYDTDDKFYKPLPIIYRSERLVDFKDGEYYTLFWPGDNKKPSKIMIITTESIRVYKKKGNTLNLVFEDIHELGITPAFRLGGQIEGEDYPYYFTSFISGASSHWDKVVTMVSDADGSIVNHLFPEKYEWQETCPNCDGSGKVEVNLGIRSEKQDVQQCRTCDGAGWVTNRSPYGIMTIKRDAINPELPSPIPPAGYITKDIAPLVELKKQIDDEIFKGYSAINMEILHKVGENQSGKAKTIDRQDLDSFLKRISDHVFDYQLNHIIEITAYWRLKFPLNDKGLEKYLAEVSISKPVEFNVMTIDTIIEEINQASSSNVSTNYYRHLEQELINIKFSNNEYERKVNLAKLKLKPYPGKSQDALLSANAINAVTEIDLIRNENIDLLVDIAIAEDESFIDKSFMEQLVIINEMIEEKYLKGDDPNVIPPEPAPAPPPVIEEEEDELEDELELENE